ncbi:hypothetical protein EYF80_015570 [Liparis tanakae]|uniref:Uncharacterized protein n=1 Tax=Liparis tanakae TaxID=230148 RepID=A0A4Z2I9Q1_9TELE|nr:hypothetical protein EYF80_015570 [Liparis tanakae]
MAASPPDTALRRDGPRSGLLALLTAEAEGQEARQSSSSAPSRLSVSILMFWCSTSLLPDEASVPASCSSLLCSCFNTSCITRGGTTTEQLNVKLQRRNCLQRDHGRGLVYGLVL